MTTKIWFRRICAFSVDSVLLSVLVTVSFLPIVLVLVFWPNSAEIWSTPEEMARDLTQILLFMFVPATLLYFGYTESGPRRSPGKKLFRLRLQRVGGGELGFIRAASRGLVKMAFYLLCHVGLGIPLLFMRRWPEDYCTGTEVVENTPDPTT